MTTTTAPATPDPTVELQTNLLTASEAAEALGVHRNTVHNMTRDGRLPAAAKLPGVTGAWLYSAAAVEASRAYVKVVAA